MSPARISETSQIEESQIVPSLPKQEPLKSGTSEIGPSSKSNLELKVNGKYSPEREVFVFTYKKGHSIITVHFQDSSLSDAVSNAKEVCRVRHWTWIGVTPFLRDIKENFEIIYAKDQPEYIPLPALKMDDGLVITRWKLSFVERFTLFFTGSIWLSLLTFNGPLQPVKLDVKCPSGNEY
jgi:hypothetical protein